MTQYNEIHNTTKNSKIEMDKEVKRTPSVQTFDGQRFNNNYFLSELNKCQTRNEVINLVDAIVEGFKREGPNPNIIGSTGNMFSKVAYSNGGVFYGFIDPTVKISNATVGFSYHIYDRDYLYSFALGIRKMNLSKNANLFQYVMRFLDLYFGFPKDSVDRRDDVYFFIILRQFILLFVKFINFN